MSVESEVELEMSEVKSIVEVREHENPNKVTQSDAHFHHPVVLNSTHYVESKLY